jgi:hypothetical protein
LIDDFDEAVLARRQRAALDRAGVPAAEGLSGRNRQVSL